MFFKENRGRDLFCRFKLLINIVELIFKSFPASINILLWRLTESWRGKLGLLIRYVIIRNMAKGCGNIVYIGPYVEIKQWNNIQIGSNVSIHRFCFLDASGGIDIGDNVSIAHGSSILTSNHTWSDQSIPIRDNPVYFKSVHIEDDVWIGCGCRIMAGVTIGERSVIAAGAIVTADVSSNTLVGGVPARFIKHLDGEQAESTFHS